MIVAPADGAASQIAAIPMSNLGNRRMEYPAFRESFFYDKRLNTALKASARQPDRLSYVRESQRMWTTQGPSIDPRLPRTTVKPGTAFRNECISADQLYSSSHNSMGYGKATTPECVGPGSYDVLKKPRGLLTAPPPRLERDFPPPDRLAQWGGRADSRAMDSAGEWKFTSEKPSETRFSFRKARASTWIEQIEQRQRREDPLARRKPTLYATASAEQRLPHFLQGTGNPVHIKPSVVVSSTLSTSAPSSPRPLYLSASPPSIDVVDEN
ncbi:hypothetical protein BBJ28_00009383 [Nothophytophthora sp. Chile5]|nr:hypothetical protein BBJ28_00009383 [Nothophytophthora sp. Chile5]